jgi:hypothetical protein
LFEITIMISEKINSLKADLDRLAVQFALGKAEAREQFESLKNDFNKSISRWKIEFGELSTGIKTKLQELELQLALGKAETKEEFEKQWEKIKRSLSNLEQEVREKLDSDKMTAFRNELEIFKLKFEIVKIRFQMKASEYDQKFRDGLNNTVSSMEETISNLKQRWQKNDKIQGFKIEMESALNHLKQAIRNLTS